MALVIGWGAKISAVRARRHQRRAVGQSRPIAYSVKQAGKAVNKTSIGVSRSLFLLFATSLRQRLIPDCFADHQKRAADRI